MVFIWLVLTACEEVDDLVLYKEVPDENLDQFKLTAVNVKVEDFENLPSIGNGHVATVVYSDHVFMNGLYNGRRGNSHRGKIPSGNNIRIRFPNGDDNIKASGRNLTLDVSRAIFTETWSLSVEDIESGEAGVIFVEQRTFAHRHFPTLIVTQIQVETRNLEDDITLQVSSKIGGDGSSEDIVLVREGEFLESPLNRCRFMCAEIKEKEDDDKRYEDKIISGVCTIRSPVPPTITIWRNVTRMDFTFITGYASKLEEVKADFNSAAQLILEGRHDQILKMHVDAWQAIFMKGGHSGSGPIQVEGNLKLAKLIDGCFYYILSSLPFSNISSASNFHGLSPSGLPYGSKGTNYQGHSFWDTETWMFPPILFFYPDAAKNLLNYRLSRIQGAREKALATGFKGARFPWESASTGLEVSPDKLSEGARSQIHISSDISFAARQYISMTRDIKWLQDKQFGYLTNGYGLIRDIAEFWVSRAKPNASAGYYEITDVMSPDEDHSHVDNNGFTNVGAGYSIFFAKYAECLSKGDPQVPDEWLEVAKGLKLIYDKAKSYHPEYEGYENGTLIKQADVILMGYPLLYEMPKETRKNDVETYTRVSRDNGPAMTWSMHTIAYSDMDNVREAEVMFNRSYQWYMEEPFKIWREWLPWRVPPSEYKPAVNFITGMGGFLQSVISGYGGLRVYPEKILIRKPRVLPGSEGLVFRGINYLGNEIDIKILEGWVRLKVRRREGRFPLQISEGGKQPVRFGRGVRVYSTKGEGFYLEITTSTKTNCEVPYDKIGESPEKREWWRNMRPAYRKRGFYDDKGCSVPFDMKPVKRKN